MYLTHIRVWTSCHMVHLSTNFERLRRVKRYAIFFYKYCINYFILNFSEEILLIRFNSVVFSRLKCYNKHKAA